jgi:hypothetical protein
MSGELPPWRLRAVDYIGLGFLLVFTEELWRSPKTWYSWAGALAIGIALLWAGEAVPRFWNWMRGRAVDSSAKLRPNVRFVGFKRIVIDPDFPDLALAALCFENVLATEKSVDDFSLAQLRVTYVDSSTKRVIAQAFPARWHESPDTPIAIHAGETKCALIASCIGNAWTTDSLTGGAWEYDRVHVPLPLGKIKITASLVGKNNISIRAVKGMLTLQAGGYVSFKKSII